MSSGVVHTQSAVALAVGFSLGALITYDVQASQYAVGALLGIFVSPDCDVDKGFVAYGYIRRRLGDWAEYLWDRVWYMYRRSVKHGSELSHFPIISTLGRLAYLFLFCVIIPNLLLSFIGFSFAEETSFWFGKLVQNWRVVVGLMSIDLIHWFLDIATVKGQFSLSSLLAMTPVPGERK